MPRGDPSPKLAIGIDPKVHKEGLAAADALQRRAGLAAVAKWEEQHGFFTAEETDEARRTVRTQLRTPR